MLNLTPHTIRIYAADCQTVLAELPAAGPPVRVQTPPQAPIGSLCLGSAEIPLVSAQSFRGCPVVGLPGQDSDGTYPDILVGIVGLEQVAAMYPGRVYATDTGPASVVRDAAGQILGVRRLQVAPPKSAL